MEILIAVLLLVVVAALAFVFVRSRSEASRGAGLAGRAGGFRGRRRAAGAARHDPMAEAVERHSAATDPAEAAEEELRLRAQANRVASDLHAREAAALENEAGRGGLGRPAPAREAEPTVYQDGRPVYDDAPAVDRDGRPVYDDRPVQDAQPAYYDDDGRPVYEQDRPRY